LDFGNIYLKEFNEADKIQSFGSLFTKLDFVPAKFDFVPAKFDFVTTKFDLTD
jgi:hypothetical protein